MDAKRPNGVTLVGVACLIAGLLSTCCNLYGMVGAAAQIGLGQLTGDVGQSGDGAQMLAVARQMGIFSAALSMLGIGAALSIVAGAGLVLSMKPAGRIVLLSALAMATLVALGEAASGIWMMQRFERMLPSGAGGGGFGGFGGSGGGLLAFGIAQAAVWLAVKLAVYVPCAVYMALPQTAALFARSGPPGVRGE